MTAEEAGPSLWARWMGFGRLIPFVGLAFTLWVAGPAKGPLASLALLGYGAIIASFLGAMHWALAMRERPSPAVTSLLWGVVPGLLGWAALLLGRVPGLLLMAALVWACFSVDRVLYPLYRLRAWLSMRLQLTLVASISCLAGAAALAHEGYADSGCQVNRDRPSFLDRHPVTHGRAMMSWPHMGRADPSSKPQVVVDRQRCMVGEFSAVEIDARLAATARAGVGRW
jgi:hypothetical protein